MKKQIPLSLISNPFAKARHYDYGISIISVFRLKNVDV
jgi:hypothetical protein